MNWNRHETGQRADVDDSPAPLPAHQGQDRLHHPDHAEEIGLELRPGLLQGLLFQCTRLLVAGVVDQDVEPAGQEMLTHLPVILAGGRLPQYSATYGGIDALSTAVWSPLSRAGPTTSLPANPVLAGGFGSIPTAITRSTRGR